MHYCVIALLGLTPRVLRRCVATSPRRRVAVSQYPCILASLHHGASRSRAKSVRDTRYPRHARYSRPIRLSRLSRVSRVSRLTRELKVPRLCGAPFLATIAAVSPVRGGMLVETNAKNTESRRDGTRCSAMPSLRDSISLFCVFYRHAAPNGADILAAQPTASTP